MTIATEPRPARPVQFGLYLPQMRMDWPTIEHRVRLAEELGYDSVWLMDHLAAPMLAGAPIFEGWTLATALAMRTERIRIGHLVLADALRHPAVLAKAAATLDVLSEGRLDLGIGWGSVPRELRQWGITTDPAVDRAARLVETIEVLELLFSGQQVSYEGRFHQLTDVTALPRPVNGRVPLHIGGGGALTMPIVERYADWWNCPPYAVAQLATLRERSGPTRMSVMRPVGLAHSSRESEAVVETAERRLSSWGGLIAGTSDVVAAATAADVDAGADLIIATFSDFAADETLRLYAAEVMPVVRAWTTPAR